MGKPLPKGGHTPDKGKASPLLAFKGGMVRQGRARLHFVSLRQWPFAIKPPRRLYIMYVYTCMCVHILMRGFPQRGHVILIYCGHRPLQPLSQGSIFLSLSLSTSLSLYIYT